MTNDDRKNRGSNALRWVAGLGVSGVLIGGLLWLADPAEVWAAVLKARMGPLVVAAGLYVTVLLIRWVRLLGLVGRDALAGHRVDLLWVSSGHSFANQLMPARTGELTFPVLWRRATGRNLADGAVLLGAIRIVELGVVVPLFGLGLAAWLSEQKTGGEAGWLPWAIVGLGVGLVVALPALLRVSLRAAEWLLLRTKLADVDLLAPLREALPEAEAAIEGLGRGKQLWMVGTTVLMWLAMFGVFYATVIAFAPHLGLPQVVVGSGGGIVGNLVPLGGIGSLGTMEAGWVGAFRATGAPLEPVVAAGLVVHALVILGSGVVTAVAAVLSTGSTERG